MPKVSVIIPCYNASGCIDRAIDSVRSQSFSDWEIVIVDDCSRDNSVEIISKAARSDDRIRLIESQENRGPSAARNTAIHSSRGEWVCVLDADDAYKPDRIGRMVEHAEAHRLDFVADNQVLFDLVAGQPSRIAFDIGGREFVGLDLEMLFANDYPGISFGLGLLKPIMRREFLIENGIRYPEDLRMGEDFTLYANILASGGRAHLLGDAYYIYSEQLGSVSREKSAYTHTDQNWRIVLDQNKKLESDLSGLTTDRQRKSIKNREYKLNREVKFVRTRQRFSESRSMLALMDVVASVSFWERLMRRIRRQSQSTLRIPCR